VNDWLEEEWPFEKMKVTDMIIYELLDKPIVLKNGAEVKPSGWVTFYKIDPRAALKVIDGH